MALNPDSQRVLLLAPVGRDAVLTQQLLAQAGIESLDCQDGAGLKAALEEGAGCILLTQEALRDGTFDALDEAIRQQEPWSDLPILVLLSNGPKPLLYGPVQELQANANLHVLERPVKPAALVAAVSVALRARRRQYELRAQTLARTEAEHAERLAHAAAEAATSARNQFVASVAHDVKNPLAAIKGIAQLLRRHSPERPIDPQRLTESTTEIAAIVDKIVDHLDDLIDLTTRDNAGPLPLQREPVDLVELANRSIASLRVTAINHSIELECDQPVITGSWDPRRLERVVGNLLSNAVKYSPRGGTIRVRLSKEEAAGKLWATLTVTDEGLGIPAEDLPRIFDGYFRGSNVNGHYPGSGLGLAGVRQIVDQHEGEIAVTSEVGKGSTFTVRLPAGTEQPALAPA